MVTEPVIEKSEEQTHYHQSFNAWKNVGKSFTKQEFMTPAFLTDSSKTPDTVKLNKDWVGQKLSGKEMDALVQEDHTYMASKEELERSTSMWTLQPNDPTYSGLLFLRHDYKAAVSLKNHLYEH